MNRTLSALPLAAPVNALRTAIVADPIRKRRVRWALAFIVLGGVPRRLFYSRPVRSGRDPRMGDR